nr:MAG TPA: hypothetical protein [Caudoviricetes sp.]
MTQNGWMPTNYVHNKQTHLGFFHNISFLPHCLFLGNGAFFY